MYTTILKNKNDINTLSLGLYLEVLKNKKNKNVLNITYKNNFFYKGLFENISNIKMKQKIKSILKKHNFNVSDLQKSIKYFNF